MCDVTLFWSHVTKNIKDSETIILSYISMAYNIYGLSQISYSLVVILELNNVPEVQYKDMMMTDDEKYQQE